MVQIEEFLHNHSATSLYLREKNGRIYLLKQQTDSHQYVLEFHSYTEEDVSLFARVQLWQQAHRTHTLAGGGTTGEAGMEEIIVKKDGQLMVKGLQAEQEKMVYL